MFTITQSNICISMVELNTPLSMVGSDGWLIIGQTHRHSNIGWFDLDARRYGLMEFAQCHLIFTLYSLHFQ
jgi:hypothetical protein